MFPYLHLIYRFTLCFHIYICIIEILYSYIYFMFTFEILYDFINLIATYKKYPRLQLATIDHRTYKEIPGYSRYITFTLYLHLYYRFTLCL